MSLEINWDLLSSDKELNDSIRQFIDEQFQNIELPDFIKDIKVTDFEIGKVAPEITVRHIGDPFEEFYESDSDEFTNDESENEKSGYEDDEESDIEESSDGSFETKEGNFGTAKKSGNFKDSLNSKIKRSVHSTKKLKKSSNDVQMIVEIDYKGDLLLEISTNLLLNFPSKSFIELPIKLKMTELIIHSLAIISYAKKLVNFSFLCDISDDEIDELVSSKSHLNGSSSNIYSSIIGNNLSRKTRLASPSRGVSKNNSSSALPTFSTMNNMRFMTKDRINIIRDLKVDSEIGGGDYGTQANGSILKNVGKVEKFLVEKLRSVLRDELAWPGWISFDFSSNENTES